MIKIVKKEKWWMGGGLMIIISRVIKIIRVANRIADGKFKLDGKEYQLAQVETIGIIIVIIMIIIKI